MVHRRTESVFCARRYRELCVARDEHKRQADPKVTTSWFYVAAHSSLLTKRLSSYVCSIKVAPGMTLVLDVVATLLFSLWTSHSASFA